MRLYAAAGTSGTAFSWEDAVQGQLPDRTPGHPYVLMRTAPTMQNKMATIPTTLEAETTICCVQSVRFLHALMIRKHSAARKQN